MKTKDYNSLEFLLLMNSQNRLTSRLSFSTFFRALFFGNAHPSQIGRMGQDTFNLNNHVMKQNTQNGWQSASVLKLPMMLFFGMLLAVSTFSYGQTGTNNLPMARMTHDNNITIRSGLNDTYQIHMEHFGFTSTQEAVSYFQSRDVNYINFTVVDVNTVLMQFDVTNPAVANWTIADWNQALATRAANAAPRALTPVSTGN